MSELFSGLPVAVRPLRELPASYIKTDWEPPTEFPSLAGVKRLAVDVETRDPDINELGPGVRRSGNYIVGIAVGTDDGRRWYFPMRHEGGGNLDARRVLAWACAELGAYTGEVTGAHLIYDLDWLAHEGVKFDPRVRFLDVQNAEPLIDENRRRFALEALAQDYLGEGKVTTELARAATAYGWKTDTQLKRNLWRLPAALVGRYAEGDVDLPLRILPLQLKKLEEEQLLGIFDVETRLVPLLLAMRRRGVAVNVDRARALRVKLVEQRDATTVAIRRLAGQGASVTLPDTLGPALELAGITVPRTPKTGAYSVTSELLERHASVPLCALIREARQLNTIINTFIDGTVLEHAVNGRIHCEFNQLKRDEGGTIARFSSSNPNLQNIPARDDVLAPLVRALWEADEGDEWQRHDLSQIEYRFLVHYARGPGAEQARERYRQDPTISFHKFAGELFGLSDAKGEVYKRLKNTNFCKVYGGGDKKLAATFNSSLAEAQQFSQRYDRELPFVNYTFSEAERLAQERGYVKTILGRRRRFPLWEPRWRGHDEASRPLPLDEARQRYGPALKRVGARNALNGMLQGGAADYIKKAMVDIWESGVVTVLGPPLLTVHDELDFNVPRTVIGREAAAEAKRLLETAVKLRVPVYAEVTTGKNWGEAS